MKTTPIQFGKFQIPAPCPVPEEELRRTGHGNQFCDRCQQSVYNISGMEPREIEALRKKNGGKLCVAFYEATPPLAHNKPRPFFYRLMPDWLRGTAASAAFFSLLLQAPQASASMPTVTFAVPMSPILSGPEKPNLLLSSVILDQNDGNIPDDVIITIELANGVKYEIVSNAGFFKMDLSELANPEEKICIVIQPQKFEDHSGSRTYPASRTHVKAGEAQNTTLKLDVAYTYNRMMRGGLRR